ncbi:unnamed protein product [Arctia plantaginis]|uniref:Pentraxin (PTX) domain-containing protein n=1 Tax=Arctia plantaginis TaxID=874455 RepID=A0A8S1BK33_ARCPL|nr:unnamed protein product [Arctia plantaginis]
MSWLKIIVFLRVLAVGLSINRPVYKVALTQKGFAQFLQYDIDTPPLREFTFCTWFRIYDLSGDQSIFTYVAQGNNRVVRLWLDSGGRHINVSINGKVTSNTPVDITKDVWRHICLSYQSDHGAWAVYMDSRLISCQASQSVFGFILPGNGSLIVGYGTDVNGAQNGLEGEIFGTNMILSSTIERNHTLKNDPMYEQKSFHKNTMKGGEPNARYIVLGDLQTDEVNNNFETTSKAPFINSTKSFIRFRTPYSYIEHEIGRQEKNGIGGSINANNFFPLPVTDKNIPHTTVNTWNLNTHSGKYRSPNRHKDNTHNSNAKGLSFISEFEVPPPVSSANFYNKAFGGESQGITESIYKINEDSEAHTKFEKKHQQKLSEIETPPPIDKNAKGYGQWTSSKFAGSVLNYLKNLQLRRMEQAKSLVPQTIPLAKTYDSFPYASSFNGIKVRAPTQFHRKNIVEKQYFESKRTPQINVKILEEDLRSNIIRNHAQTFPKHVEISNRGMRKRQEGRFYRNANYQESSRESSESKEKSFRTKTFDFVKARKVNPIGNVSLQTYNLMSILPFLKSLEYFIDDSQTVETKDVSNNSDIYTRSLSTGNKWHNVKSYSNDYTPREIKMGLEDNQKNLNEKIDQLAKKHPSIRLKYNPEIRKLVHYKEDESILKGRELAREITNQSNTNTDSVSILKYNHGFLPVRKQNSKSKVWQANGRPITKGFVKSSFNKNVKIGNALNERPIIGDSVEQNKKSFVGGDERVPDINKFRADVDSKNVYSTVPGSLGPRICKNVEFYDRVLYVQPDGSIDKTHIMSPLRMKTNLGIEFIMQNYKKCSLQESNFQNDLKLFIDWSKTPVRLFGGAYPRKTTDLCGFF